MASEDSIKELETFIEDAVGTIVDRSVSGFQLDALARTNTESDVLGRAVSDFLARPSSFLSGLSGLGDDFFDSKLPMDQGDDEEANVPMETFPMLNRGASIDLAPSRAHAEPGTIELRVHRACAVARRGPLLCGPLLSLVSGSSQKPQAVIPLPRCTLLPRARKPT